MTIATETPAGLATALTPEQRRIVEWGDGPVVVIAGAGTGKTRVIVERVRHLLETATTTSLPEQILVLTYNVKAARELAAAPRRSAIGVAVARAHDASRTSTASATAS